MITVEQALALVLAAAQPRPPQRVTLAEAAGMVLAEDVASDIDSPPWDKSIVDGYAVLASDLRSGQAQLTLLEEVVAGAVPTKPVVAGSTTRIMTGAPIPAGADAVIMIERSEVVTDRAGNADKILLHDTDVRAGRNILRRGTSMRAGDVVLPSGVLLRAPHLGLLAEVGRASVAVISRPTVDILATGNELVPPDVVPAPGQIRNSNGVMLAAAARQAGAATVLVDTARDVESDLREKISRGLQADVLILSGGVSAGVLDLVPRVLAESGAKEVFHKVRLKPGKPLWFGVAERDGHQTLIFGLPGNPVSSFVCCELFVRPAIERLSGRPGAGLRRTKARLEADFRQRGDRHTFLPAVVSTNAAGELTLRPADWHGSADLRGLVAANALASFVAGDRLYAAGESVEVVLLEST